MSADNDNLKPRYAISSLSRLRSGVELEDDLDDEKLAGMIVMQKLEGRICNYTSCRKYCQLINK